MARAAEEFPFDAPTDAPWRRAQHLVSARMPGVLDRFVALVDPTHVLAEVEAKRRIVDDCADYIDHEMATDGLSGRVLAFLALPYADRPGY